MSDLAHLIHLIAYNDLDDTIPAIRVDLFEPLQKLVECLPRRHIIDWSIS